MTRQTQLSAVNIDKQTVRRAARSAYSLMNVMASGALHGLLRALQHGIHDAGYGVEFDRAVNIGRGN